MTKVEVLCATVTEFQSGRETADKPTAGVYVFSPEGQLLELIPIPRDETNNCAFGGDDLKTLFVTSGGTLWNIRVTTPDHPVFPK